MTNSNKAQHCLEKLSLGGYYNNKYEPSQPRRTNNCNRED